MVKKVVKTISSLKCVFDKRYAEFYQQKDKKLKLKKKFI